MNKPYFHCVLQLDKLNVFEVNYYKLGNNKNPHFTTSAARLIRSKRDYHQCGQSQETICKPFKDVYQFYKKWNTLQLKDLSLLQYLQIFSDLTTLGEKYNFILSDNEISFSKIVELSKQKPIKRK